MRAERPGQKLPMSGAAEAIAAAVVGEATRLAPSLLDQVIAATRPQSTAERQRAKDYFGQFLAHFVQPGQVVSKEVETNIKTWVAEIH
jgi:hypothetical protein